MKVLMVLSILLVLHCGAPGVEHIITQRGGVFEFDGMRIEVPEASVAESTAMEIEIKSIAKKTYEQGFTRLGTSFTINPTGIVFDKPAHFSMPAEKENIMLAARIGAGFVPLANSQVKAGTLTAQIWHGGTYELITAPQEYGIIDHSDTESALLVVSDVYVSDYIKNFVQAVNKSGYQQPVWIFIYPQTHSIRDNATFLAEELKKLHAQYGVFRLDIVSFGLGGLITHCYVSDTALYMRDLSSAIITVGTPFHGSQFADFENAKTAKSPFRFFYIDALGQHADELLPESEFIAWVRTQKGFTRGHFYDDIEENKNFASLSGRYHFEGRLAEESDGDGLISVAATMLTPIEPVPFGYDHFALIDNSNMHSVINKFVQLYRGFNWPATFSKVWDGKESPDLVPAIWEKEARLIYHRDVDFKALLEFNRNILQSAPKDAILITNGDNDTYPAWFLQKKGVREDVMIVNRSLFNLKEYIRFLQKRGLPLELTEAELAMLQHKKENGVLITISDQLIKLLLQQDRRPVVFATTVYDPQKFGYPLKLSGMVYEIGEGKVDIERTKEFFYAGLVYDAVSAVPLDSLTEHIRNIVANYAASLYQLTEALEERGDYGEALKALTFARRFGDTPLFYLTEASLHTKMGRFDRADSTFEALLKMQDVDTRLKKEIARTYHDMGMDEKAIKLLAECLQEDPDDRESIELIQQYQEK